MAEQLASAAMEMILTTLRDAAVREIRLYRNFQTDLDNLETTFKSIQWVLQDAEIKQWKDVSIRGWLRNLKDASYEVEDILDEVATEGLRRKAEFRRGNNSIPCFSLSYPLRFRSKIAHKMKVMREKLSQIEKEKDAFHLTRSEDNDVGVRYGVTKEDRETTSLVDESEIYGRRVEKEMIVGKLLDEGLEQDDLYVYVICGMGGLGKTTLAKLVYNDVRTQNHFDARIWVCVSNDFNKKRLVQAMIGTIDGLECNIPDLEQLQRCLREKLNGKRFLVVLDDVWNEKESEWEELRKILECGVNGCVVMVTTRIETIANMMVANNLNHQSCNPICQIEKLSHEDSMSFFKRRAFPTSEMESKLISIGEAIVKKCDGVPLAIKALGGFMKDKSGEREWLAIEKSEIWNLTDNGILPSLRLSYFNLPPHTRQCFAYCCIFRKDEEMEVDRLIQLWMANGFVVSSDGLKDLPLIGQNIFKELTWRSFFQDIGTNSAGKKTCKMHDLMHDLAVSIMGHETYTPGQSLEIPKGLRHVFSDDDEDKILVSSGISLRSFKSESLMKMIRSIGGSWELSKDLCSFLSKQQYLRALEIPWSVINLDLGCKLKHLRFLVMACWGMKKLPKSLICLFNLQTLKLMHSSELCELPKDLNTMEKLCFLEVEDFDSLGCMPPDLGKLTSLCRLSVFVVGEDISQRIDQLKELNLGGELSITGLENVKSSIDAESANLKSKVDMTSLKLYWRLPQNMEQDRREGQRSKSTKHFHEVLVGLQPHENIAKVCIEYYPGSKFPEWMSSSNYKNLKEIAVVSCTNCEHLPPLGKLPFLTSLQIRDMDSVMRLGVEWHGDGECSFPALKELKILNMPNLEEWSPPDSVECFPCLTHLSIGNCPKLDSLPHCFPCLTELSIRRLPSWTRLKINTMNSVKCLGVECSFPALKKLEICNMPNLEEWSLPDSVDCFPCLTQIRIVSCPKLDSLPALPLQSLSLGYKNVDTPPKDLLQNNRALKTLDIFGSIKSVSNMLDNLSSLKSLFFFECPNLEVVPEILSCLHSLETLYFVSCERLETFPVTILQGLPSIRFLEFMNCERLEIFPGPIKVVESTLHELYICRLPKLQHIPESLASLKSLKKLYISSCGRQLKKRCEKLNGEDWPKISHIPTIDIH